jgi:lipid A 3-O-deacylase
MGERSLLVLTLRKLTVAAAVAVGLALVVPGIASAQTAQTAQTTQTVQAPQMFSNTTFGFAPLPTNPNANPPLGIIDEVKAGGLWHDVGFLGDHKERGADINLEMLFTSPDFLAILGSPRPHIGGDYNTAGQTSDVFAGLTWGISVIQNLFRPGDAVFLTGSLGGAYQDGYIDSAPLGRKELGSPILFRESAELGYQVTPVISVSAILEHISNADLGQHNAGITSAGARVGFKF